MYFDDVEWLVHDLWYVQCFVLRRIIFTKLNDLYLLLWMYFNYAESLASLNDLNGLIKISPGKFPETLYPELF